MTRLGSSALAKSVKMISDPSVIKTGLIKLRRGSKRFVHPSSPEDFANEIRVFRSIRLSARGLLNIDASLLKLGPCDAMSSRPYRSAPLRVIHLRSFLENLAKK